MKKILYSILTVGAVGALAFGASQAFFSDTETSTDNTFVAGSLDLKVDSVCHYWVDDEDVGCGEGAEFGNWDLDDLEAGVHKFFNFDDIKPGDYGEDTISLHVYDNDAWGRLVIDSLANDDNGLTDPESDVDATGGAGEGELRQNLSFWVWLDQGLTPGFQNDADPGEGDNIYDPEHELMLITPGDIDEGGETWYLADGLSAAAAFYGVGDGLELDGHLVGSVTYYFGIGWELPSDVGNEVQSDSFSGDMTIEVEQYRNNPSPF